VCEREGEREGERGRERDRESARIHLHVAQTDHPAYALTQVGVFLSTAAHSDKYRE
jgi:hypothetical protein